MAASNRSMKRKGSGKFDLGFEDSWWKRRSSRKGVDKSAENEESELKIQIILKKFFDESYLK